MGMAMLGGRPVHPADPVAGEAQIPEDTDETVPPNKLCLPYCVVAARNIAQWKKIVRDEHGFIDLRALEAVKTAEARAVLQHVIYLMEADGKHEEAKRLLLDGPSGYPGIDELPYFAAVLGGSVQLVHRQGFVPTRNYGEGPLVMRIAHVLTKDGSGNESFHFVIEQCWQNPKPTYTCKVVSLGSIFHDVSLLSEALQTNRARNWIVTSLKQLYKHNREDYNKGLDQIDKCPGQWRAELERMVQELKKTAEK